MSFRLLEWWRRFQESFRHRADNEREEELRFHLEMAELDAVHRGQSVREARLQAGGIAQAAEAVRDQGAIRWLSDFLRDSRHGIRLLGRSPLFTAAAIVSLALGIGANTAIFSLMDAVTLRMMPVHEPSGSCNSNAFFPIRCLVSLAGNSTVSKICLPNLRWAAATLFSMRTRRR